MMRIFSSKALFTDSIKLAKQDSTKRAKMFGAASGTIWERNLTDNLIGGGADDLDKGESDVN